MAPAADPHQVNDFPVDPSSRFVPRQPHGHAPQNAWAPPAPANGHPEGLREDIPPPIGSMAGPGTRAQDPHHVDVAHQGIVNYHPRPFANPAYVFPDTGYVQNVPVQGQSIAPVNQDHDFFAYIPQHVAPGPPPAAFPRVPTLNQVTRTENLRRLANRYLDDPNAQVRMISTEEGTAGGFQVVIILEMPNVP